MKNDTALARRPHSAPRIVSPRNKVTVAFPLSMIRAEKPATMDPGDWISLARLVVSAVGFSLAIRQLARIANASQAGREHRAASSEAEGQGTAGSSSLNGTAPDGSASRHEERVGQRSGS